jgi:dolichol kinase
MSAPAMRQELGRKLVHLGMGILPVLIATAPPPWSWRGPVFAFCSILGLDLARLLHPGLRRWSARRLGGALRAGEHAGLISVHYLTGAAVVLSLALPAALAALALANLVVGDAVAAIVGRRWGRHRLGRKTVEGSAACFLACFGVGWGWMPERPLLALAAALTSTAIEALPLPVDDNWSVPLVTGAVLALLA